MGKLYIPMPQCFICGAKLDETAKCNACYDEMAAERDHLKEKLSRLIRICKDLYLPADDDERQLKQAISEIEGVGNAKS